MCWAPLCPPRSDGDRDTPPIHKLPHSSPYTQQNLLKAEGKGRLIKKPYLPAGTTAPSRREPFRKQRWAGKGCSQHPAPAAWPRMLAQSNSTAWHVGNESIKPTDWPQSDSEIVLSDLYFLKKRVHPDLKKKIKNKKSLQSWA